MRNHSKSKKIEVSPFFAILIFGMLCFSILPSLISEKPNISPNFKFNNPSAQEKLEDPTPNELETYYNNEILHFYGDGVSHVLNISKKTLLNNTYESCENINFTMLNKMGTKEEIQISGVYLHSIFELTGILNQNATYIRFIGNDGYKSYYFPIRILNNNTHSVIITTEENGEIPEKGPLEGNVIYDSIANDTEMIAMFHALGQPGENFVYNSVFNAHYLSAIEVSIVQLNYNNTDTTESSSNTVSNNPVIPGYIGWKFIFPISYIFASTIVIITQKKKSRKLGK
ncbi:MAG: hypothetical protein ACTSVU_03650 [Promethearchaeota archaeon]